MGQYEKPTADQLTSGMGKAIHDQRVSRENLADFLRDPDRVAKQQEELRRVRDELGYNMAFARAHQFPRDHRFNPVDMPLHSLTDRFQTLKVREVRVGEHLDRTWRQVVLSEALHYLETRARRHPERPLYALGQQDRNGDIVRFHTETTDGVQKHFVRLVPPHVPVDDYVLVYPASLPVASAA
jgi:hypothetical protein